jgi:hypothetical protein
VTEETKMMDKWDGLMEQIQHETLLICDCVQKGMLDEGMIMIKIAKDDEGRAIIDVGLAVHDDMAKKIAEEREKRKN